jgi:hypothetical protein
MYTCGQGYNLYNEQFLLLWANHFGDFLEKQSIFIFVPSAQIEVF